MGAMFSCPSSKNKEKLVVRLTNDLLMICYSRIINHLAITFQFIFVPVIKIPTR